MTLRTNILAAGLGAAVLFAAGCATHDNASAGEAPDTQPAAAQQAPQPQATPPPPAERDLVQKDDFLTLVKGGVPPQLQNTIEVRNYTFDFESIQGKPEVRLDVFNRLPEETVAFEIRTLFFREDGSIVDATPWVQASAPARGTYRYRAISFSQVARSEQVQIRLLNEDAG